MTDETRPVLPGDNAARLLAPLLIALAGVLFAVMASPLALPTPDWDAGVFDYVGWRMLEGEVPYRDVWDHKPPVIFFFCAAGLLLGGGSVWGVFALQAVFMTAGLLLAYACLRRFYGSLTALLTVALGYFFIVIAGQLTLETEELYIPYAFASIALYLRTVRLGPRAWMSAALGAVAMLSFLTKQILIGMPIAIVLCLAFRLLRERQFLLLLRSVAWYLLGAGGLAGLIVLYFALNGAAWEFWEAAFLFNFGYAETTERGALLWADRMGYFIARDSGLLVPAAAGIVASMLILRLRPWREAFGNPLLALALVAFPFEMYFSAISGRGYRNYFLCWAPALMLFAAVPIHHLLNGFPRPGGEPRLRIPPPIPVLVCLVYVLGAGAWVSRTWTFNMFEERNAHRFVHRARTIEFLKDQTGPDDTVLMWGLEATVNFTARRRSPTRFMYMIPLVEPFHPDASIVPEFSRALRDRPPALIIDASHYDVWTPPIDRERWKRTVESGDKQFPREGIREIADYICDNYVYVGRLLNWHVYARPGFEVRLPPMSQRERERYNN